jgi:hypothetical protein
MLVEGWGAVGAGVPDCGAGGAVAAGGVCGAGAASAVPGVIMSDGVG